MKDVVIVSACRTAIGTFGGSLKNSHATTLGSVVMKEAVKRAGIDAGIINDVRFGNCMPPENSLNPTRVAALLAGGHADIPAEARIVGRGEADGADGAALDGLAFLRRS